MGRRINLGGGFPIWLSPGHKYYSSNMGYSKLVIEAVTLVEL